MKIKTIELQHYKAFGEYERLEVDGKNVLIYGNNGSGKTSLAHALQALIQSSAKTIDDIHQTFDRRYDHNIVNLDMPDDATAFVRVTTDDDARYEYSLNGNTNNNQVLKGANQVSDFINYRLLLRFFMFHEAQDIDIFPIIQDQFFSFWTDTARNQTYQDWFAELETKLGNLKAKKKGKESPPYTQFVESLTEFNNTVQRQILNLNEHANDFLKIYLSPDDPIGVTLRFIRGFELDSDPKKRFDLHPPICILALSVNGKPVNRPHTFLNEARLTALALALRFAAFEERPKGVSEFKILVLDDLLISLDMSLRMRVIQALVDSYKNYQFFILTHDKGLYNFLGQALVLDDNGWKRFEFYENTIDGKSRPYIGNTEDLLEKASKCFDSKEYDVCAVYLRKKAEELTRIYYDPSLEALARYQVLENLSNALAGFHAEYNQQLVNQVIRLLDSQSFPLDLVKKFKTEPFESKDLTPKEIGQINAFKKYLLSFVETYYSHREELQNKRNELTTIAQKVSFFRSVLLNPGTHEGGIDDLVVELKNAFDVLKSFDEKIKEYVKKNKNAITR